MKVKGETYTATREQLMSVQLPAETRTYKPYSHRQVIEATIDGIQKAGFEIAGEMYRWAKEGDVANGRFMIKGVEDNEMQLQVCWQNSYNKSLPLTFALSANILVCTNGMIAPRDVSSFKKKHWGDIQIFSPHAIPEYIKRGGEMFLNLQEDRDRMKQIEVSRRLTAELLGRLFFEEQLLESTQLNIVKRELENPTHNYGSPDSLWSLYQHVTFAIGGIHPSHWMQDHIEAHRFFSNVMNKVEDAELVLL